MHAIKKIFVPHYVYKISLILILTGLLSSCINNKKTPQEKVTATNETNTPTTEKVIDPANSVYFKGTSNHTESLEYFHIMNFSYLYGTNQHNLHREIKNDTLQLVYNESNGAQLKEIMYFGKDNFLNFKIFVTPGDTLNFKITNGNMIFEGTHASDYNFFPQLNAKNYDWPHYKEDIKLYKKEAKEVYTKKITFLEEYLKNHKDVTEGFKKTVKEELYFEYYYNLIAPRSIKSTCLSAVRGAEIYFNDVNSVFSTLKDNAKNASGMENVFNTKDYFDNIQLSTFKKPDLITNDYYKRAIADYVRYYFVNHDYFEFNKENFFDEKEFIEKNFEGKVKNYLLAKLIADYYKKGFGRSKKAKTILKNTIEEFRKTTIDSSYLAEIKNIESKLDFFDLQLPNPVLEEKLLTRNGDTITIKEILNKEKGNKKVIDFWASWCFPCIKELKEGSNNSKKLTSSENVSFIYISTDTQKEAWDNMSKTMQPYFADKHQYLLLDREHSKLSTFFKVKFIPRTVVLSKNNSIVYDDAPRPSDSLMFNKLIVND
ncbi:hypothetical protein NBRC110019_27340 [Neptunitalea chrysea]|uniref:Thioredoxin domain-containing protein n=1 Tax=Neptunitalea chrysea TaxID=1647581 RepID=A0A9W6EWU7_9FLAO|nr:TlpA disulfide reductase family protein [Neptunitalea chrysea]GLB53693.1 hypothetical protein NBRC110019_27340 [Neptunitalea chrysea]